MALAPVPKPAAPNFPQVRVFDADDGEAGAGRDLGRWVAELGIEAPFVLASAHGHAVTANVPGPRRAAPAGAGQRWASELGSTVRRAGCDAIVAAGGGRCLDVAKLAAARAGVTVVSVPTQLSHDGICSPVAVVPGESGRSESVGAIVPRAVFISLPTLVATPVAAARAGVGDLLANPLALKDWALAAERGLDSVDERAWDLSVRSYALIEPHLRDDLGAAAARAGFVRSLADALVCSGLAMICAGTSRPASGAEHEISHAMDHLYGGRAMHGAQVAFGCILSAALHGEDVGAFTRLVARLGLPAHPSDLEMTEDDVVDVVVDAPATRPGRFTILEHADLDRTRALRLVRRIWGQR